MTRPKNGSRAQAFVRDNLLTILTVIGVMAGVATGLIVKYTLYPHGCPRRIAMYISYPGDLFLNMLKCLIVPLLVSSITSAIGALDLSMSKRIALRAILYYFVTTICAVILGIVLVTTIKPGVKASINETTTHKVPSNVLTEDTLLDLVRNMFPENLIQATMYQYHTKITLPEGGNNETKLQNYDIKEEYHRSTNVLGMVMFSIILGICIGQLGPKGKLLQDFFQVLSEAMMLITSWVIWISPLGVFFLIIAKLVEMENLAVVIGQLGLYFCTVMLGLFLHGFGTIALLFFIGTKQLPYGYVAKLGQVLATAFGTGSSSATMPLTIGCLDKMGIDPRVTRFVIPVGATINMDGTALYEAVAALFIAQIRGKVPGFGQIVAISITATAASIGAAGIPQAGLVTMVMVLETVGLPSQDVSLILAIDWLLDRFRTTINVMCDALGTILVNHLSKNDLAPINSDMMNAEPHELLELGAPDHDIKE